MQEIEIKFYYKNEHVFLLSIIVKQKII